VIPERIQTPEQIIQPVRIDLQRTIIPLKTCEKFRKNLMDVATFDNIVICTNKPTIIHGAKTMRQGIRVNEKTQTAYKNQQ